MPAKPETDAFALLENNQAELRKNIEASKELIARSDELLERYRSDREDGAARPPD